MNFGFGRGRKEQDSSETTEEPRNPGRRRFLKRAAGFAVAGSLLSSDSKSKESDPMEGGRFSDRFAAAKQLQRNGITDFQRQAYIPVVSDGLARGLYPFDYSSNATAEYNRVVTAVIGGAIVNSNQLIEDDIAKALTSHLTPEQRTKITIGRDMFHARMDAWKMYLGLPQNHFTFRISEFKPEQSTEDKYYYKIDSFLENVSRFEQFIGLTEKPIKYLLSRMEDTVPVSRDLGQKQVHPDPEAMKVIRIGPDKSIIIDLESALMNKYVLSKGKDESGCYLSYYDRWDLAVSLEGGTDIVGKPFEIYDRIYYDPKTFEVVQPKGIRQS